MSQQELTNLFRMTPSGKILPSMQVTSHGKKRKFIRGQQEGKSKYPIFVRPSKYFIPIHPSVPCPPRADISSGKICLEPSIDGSYRSIVKKNDGWKGGALSLPGYLDFSHFGEEGVQEPPCWGAWVEGCFGEVQSIAYIPNNALPHVNLLVFQGLSAGLLLFDDGGRAVEVKYSFVDKCQITSRALSKKEVLEYFAKIQHIRTNMARLRVILSA